jgi:MFS family permease
LPFLQQLGRQLKPDWMTRDMGLLLAARASMSTGRSLAGVTLPVYLATLGYNGAQLGLLFALNSLFSGLVAVLVGLLSDRFGRKPFVILIPAITAGCALLVGYTSVTVVLFAGAVIGTIGGGSGAGAGSVGPYSPAETALMTDVTPAEHRNSLFGRLAFYAALGALIGAPLAGVSDLAVRLGVHGPDAYRPAFALAAALALLTAVLALPIANPRMHHSTGRNPFAWPKRSLPFLVRFWAVIAVNGVALGFFSPFITFWFHLRFHASAGEIGLLYAIINVITMVSNLSAASIARRLGLVRAIASIWVVQALFMIPMALSPTFWLAGVFYLFRQLAQRVQMPLRQSYVMAMVPQEERGAVAGLSQLPAQVTSGLAPLPAGYLFDHISMELPIEIAGTLQVCVGGLMWLFFRTMAPPEELARAPGMQPVPEAAGTAKPQPALSGEAERTGDD